MQIIESDWLECRELSTSGFKNGSARKQSKDLGNSNLSIDSITSTKENFGKTKRVISNDSKSSLIQTYSKFSTKMIKPKLQDNPLANEKKQFYRLNTEVEKGGKVVQFESPKMIGSPVRSKQSLFCGSYAF